MHPLEKEATKFDTSIEEFNNERPREALDIPVAAI
jgi:hypothetical protein